MNRAALAVLLAACLCLEPAHADGTIEIEVVETLGSGPLPCRIHLLGSGGEPVRPGKVPFWRDHFVCEGKLALSAAAGHYRMVVERGPEYTRAARLLEVKDGETTRAEAQLRRWIDLAAQGWWSGETHVHRDPGEMPLHLRAEDLHVAPVITVWNQRNLWKDRALPEKLLAEAEPGRAYHLLAAEDERQGGALLFINLRRPPDFSGQRPEVPSPVENLRAARRQEGVWVDIEKPFWWDVPAWVATGEIDSIGIANNHMCRSTMYESEAWGRPRDAARLLPPRGNGFHTQEIYYKLLDCGFRLPPSAGSASGVLPNPVGYNRVYVHLEGEFSWESWWRGLKAGRCFVTNGPVLLVRAGGRLPGSVLGQPGEGPFAVEISIEARGNDPLEAVEIIRDGGAVERFEPEAAGGWFRKEAKLVFDRSGWFLVRAIAKVPETFRFASTGPFYVEVGGKPKTVHADAVKYFIEWIDERIERIRGGAAEKISDPAALEAVLAPHRRAREVFGALLPRDGR